MEATHSLLKTRLAAAACSAALAAACTCPPALATSYDGGNAGSTEVTVAAGKDANGAGNNLAFEVPTEIPFAANSDGTLVGPSASSCQIKNKSVFGIHVTNVKVTASSPWTIVKDNSGSTQENSIDFQFMTGGSTVDAESALGTSGVDLSRNESWDMGYAGSGKETLSLSTSGNVFKVTQDVLDKAKVATISWTLEAGSHAS